MCSERLRRYRELINGMPVEDQATISNTDLWQNGGNDLPAVLQRFRAHDGGHFVEISRRDLFALAEERIFGEFVYAVFIWGYPTGGRGDNFTRVVDGIAIIVNALREVVNLESIYQAQLNDLCARLHGHGIGPVALTKLLYFLRCHVENQRALILDSKVMKAFQRRLFEEDFGQSAEIIYEEARRPDPNYLRVYPHYLREMSRVAHDLEVDSDKLEMFLFLFSRSLKAHC